MSGKASRKHGKSRRQVEDVTTTIEEETGTIEDTNTYSTTATPFTTRLDDEDVDTKTSQIHDDSDSDSCSSSSSSDSESDDETESSMTSRPVQRERATKAAKANRTEKTPALETLLKQREGAAAAPKNNASGKIEEASEHHFKVKYGIIDKVPDILLPNDENIHLFSFVIAGTGREIYEKFVTSMQGGTGQKNVIVLQLPAKHVNDILRMNPHKNPEVTYHDISLDTRAITVTGMKLHQKGNTIGRTLVLSSAEESLNTVPVIVGNSQSIAPRAMTFIGTSSEALDKTIFKLPPSYVSSSTFTSFWGRSVEPARLGVVLLDKTMTALGREVVAVRVATHTFQNKLWSFLDANMHKKDILHRHYIYKDHVYDCYDPAAFASVFARYKKTVLHVPRHSVNKATQFKITQLPRIKQNGVDTVYEYPDFDFLKDDNTYRELTLVIGMKWVCGYEMPVVAAVKEAASEAASKAPAPSQEDIARAKNDEFYRALQRN